MGYEDKLLNVTDRVELRKILACYTEDVTRLVEKEIDDIESEIRELFPEAVFIELEPRSLLKNFLIDEDDNINNPMFEKKNKVL
jgi:hypothetical protein